MTKEELEKEANKYADNYATPDLNCSFRADMFEASKEGYLAGAEPREKRIEELEAQNKILERRIVRAKECMKKLLFIINSEPSNYNCKGLVRDAEDFIYNRTCNIRKSGNHCITEEPCIMCDR